MPSTFYELHQYVCNFEQTRTGYVCHTPRKYGGDWESHAIGFWCRKGRAFGLCHPSFLVRAAHPWEVPMTRLYRGQEPMLLCVDDNRGILAYERSLFERSGFVVITAPSAQEGLRLVTMYRFDAVLLDYHMPEMNGHNLASAIRRVTPETPVVMFSGSEVPEQTRRLVDAVVPKNGATGELLPTVARLCRRSSPA